MDLGVDVLGGRLDGILLTTDADARPPVDWIANNVDAIRGGADLVGGRLELDDAEPLPEAVQTLRRCWGRYWQLVRDIEDGIDPRPWDLPPRHGDHTGASLAMTVGTYLRAGGVPRLPTGEDSALVAAAIAQGALLVHPLPVWTRVSPRRVGRCVDGMAKDMTQLFYQAGNAEGTIAVPALMHWRRRSEWRRALRAEANGAARIAREEPLLPTMPHDADLKLIVGRRDGMMV